jgi:hypothetical protein
MSSDVSSGCLLCDVISQPQNTQKKNSFKIFCILAAVWGKTTHNNFTFKKIKRKSLLHKTLSLSVRACVRACVQIYVYIYIHEKEDERSLLLFLFS